GKAKAREESFQIEGDLHVGTAQNVRIPPAPESDSHIVASNHGVVAGEVFFLSAVEPVPQTAEGWKVEKSPAGSAADTRQLKAAKDLMVPPRQPVKARGLRGVGRMLLRVQVQVLIARLIVEGETGGVLQRIAADAAR